jgi:2'-5' RNA ligase
MVAFFLAPETAKQLALDIEGALPANELHLTLSYLGDIGKLDPNGESNCRKELEKLAQDMPPISGVITGVATFSKETDGKNPIVALFDSADLPAFRQELMKSLNKTGIDFPREHGFIPHITLAYVNKPAELDLPDVKIKFDAITLAWGDNRAVIPLKGKPRDLLEGKEADGLPVHPF